MTQPPPSVSPMSPLADLVSAPERAEEVPPALLPYQQEWIADPAQLKVAEKSRRVGLTWAEAADDVLIAGAEGGSNVFYISATQDMAREYIDACAMWARVFDRAAGELQEGLYDDGEDAAGNRRFIKTFEIVFPRSRRRITALSSRPTNLRGKQGVIVIDEAAFHQCLPELLKAAMAMLLWGDRVRIISTHDGAENAFNELIEQVRAGKRGKATVHRITFAQAVEQGLYHRVCLRRGRPWTPQAQAQWVADAYAFYGDAADEELDVVPSQSAGAYLPLALLHSRAVPQAQAVPLPGQWLAAPVVLRGKWDDAFAYLGEEVRTFAVAGWLAEVVQPWLARLHPNRRHCYGMDFARVANLSVLAVLEEDVDGVRRPLLTVELFNCPFTCQEQIVEHVVRALPRFRGGAMDAGGNGAALAEKMAQRFGCEMVEQVKLNETFYLTNMPLLKAALEDGTLAGLPRDAQAIDDLRGIKIVRGVPKVPRGDTAVSAAAKAAAKETGAALKRHGDFAVALFLANYAFHREAGEIAFTAAPDAEGFWSGLDEDDDRGNGRSALAWAGRAGGF